VVRTAVDTLPDGVPIVAAGGPTRQAIAFAQEAERLAQQRRAVAAALSHRTGQKDSRRTSRPCVTP